MYPRHAEGLKGFDPLKLDRLSETLVKGDMPAMFDVRWNTGCLSRAAMPLTPPPVLELMD